VEESSDNNEMVQSAEDKIERKFDKRRRPRNMHTRGRSKSHQRNNTQAPTENGGNGEG